jgi:hypothetical protein
LRFHHWAPPPETGYAGNRETTLWSSNAQVREPIGGLKYGERLEILERLQDQVQVRTAAGLTGWIAASDLLSTDVWQKSKDLEYQASLAPVEARGHTRAISNLHLEPGRDSARIRQLKSGVAVDIFERQTAEIAPPSSGADEKETAPPIDAKPVEAKKEDWWLVRAHLEDQTTVAGWALGRFIDLDVPAPLPDYANSAGMHIVAWFQLNAVADLSGEVKPQYLLVGTRGSEGQSCDFTLMRVYTWGKQRERYETAFVESDVCGKLPLKITRAPGPGGDVAFAFQDLTDGAAGQRTYHLHQTIVRRLSGPGSAPTKRKHGNG